MNVSLLAMNKGGTGLEVYANHLHRHLRDLHDDVHLVDDRGKEINVMGRQVGGYITRVLSNLYGEIPGDVRHATDILTLHKDADVVTLHDTYIYDHPDHYGMGGAWWRWWTRRAARCQAVIVNSDYTRRCVIDHLDVDPSKLHVTHLAARDDVRRLEIERREPSERGYYRILIVGSIKTTKNTLNTVRAVERFARCTDLPAEIVHAGPKMDPADPYHTQVLDVVRKAENVHMTHHGFVSVQELELLYNTVDCLAFPSMDEGFGIPPLEAMKCGTPVVVSAHPVFRETVSKVAHVAAWDNVPALACAIWDAVRDQRRDRLAKHAARFSWEDTARSTLDVYRQVVE